MNFPILRALCLIAPLALPAIVHAQNAAAESGRRAGEATIGGTVLSFNAVTGALKIAVESRVGEDAPGDPKAPFVTVVLPPDFKASDA